MDKETHAEDVTVAPTGRKTKLVKAGSTALVAIVTLVLIYLNVPSVVIDNVDLFLFNFIGEMI